MRRVVVHWALMVGVALVLAGCGLADSRSPVPEFMRNKAPEPPPPETPPDVKRLVRENLNSMFTAASNPRDVRVSPPLREVQGRGLDRLRQGRADLGHGQAARRRDLSHHHQRRHDRRSAASTTTPAHPRVTSRSSGRGAIRMINAGLTLPLKLHRRAGGFFQSFPLASLSTQCRKRRHALASIIANGETGTWSR